LRNGSKKELTFVYARHGSRFRIAQGFDLEYRIVRPEGSIWWIRDRRFPAKDAPVKVYRIAGVAEDISERKRAEEAL
jgi:PAS domain S-box-containing protein